jgi:hypothetical protein
MFSIFSELSIFNFCFIIESRGQLKEQRIIDVAIDNIKKRMKNQLQ